MYGDMAQRYEAALREKGLQMMCNTHITLPKQNIIVYGAEIKEECYRHFRMYPLEEDYMASILGIPDKEQFIILLAHNPDYFTRYAEWGADLVLSGHVHGGLMKLPFLGGVISPALKLFPKYDGGLFQKEGSTMILSRGLGTHTLPIRILNPGELIVVQLQPKKQDFS